MCTALVHELGHNRTLRRVSSPQNISPDVDRALDYPRSRGDTGASGFDAQSGERFDPCRTMDFMADARFT